MYHPSKAWRAGLRSILNDHLNGAVLRDTSYDQQYSLNPFDYVGAISGAAPLKGAKSFVTDQRASGLNAVLWRDPSMIV